MVTLERCLWMKSAWNPWGITYYVYIYIIFIDLEKSLETPTKSRSANGACSIYYIYTIYIYYIYIYIYIYNIHVYIYIYVISISRLQLPGAVPGRGASSGEDVQRTVCQGAASGIDIWRGLEWWYPKLSSKNYSNYEGLWMGKKHGKLADLG